MDPTIFEYRGVDGLVAAEVLADDNGADGYKTGEVFPIAGVAEIAKTSDSSSEAHYYDNGPKIVVQNESSDTITITASAIPLDVLAKLTGQIWSSTLGAFIEGKKKVKYFAIGYRTQTVEENGRDPRTMYVWRYKGSFAMPDQNNATINSGTDANGQTLVYTGIETTHKFAACDNEGCKALVVDSSLQKVDVSTFFDQVTTPDNLEADETYTLSITEGAGTSVAVIRGGSVLANGATLYAGDVLTVYVAGGTITINGEAATDGDSVTVSANVAIVSAA